MKRPILIALSLLLSAACLAQTLQAQSPWRRLFDPDKKKQSTEQQRQSDDDDYQRRLDQYRRSEQYQRYEPPPPQPKNFEMGAGVILDGGNGSVPMERPLSVNPSGNSRIQIVPSQRQFDQPVFSSPPPGAYSSAESAPSGAVIVGGRARLETDEGNRHIVIERHLRTGAIYMEISQLYGPKDMDRLKQTHPELTDYIDVFPDSIDGAKIELGISLTRVVEADSAAELETKDQTAFNLYQRYESQLTSATNQPSAPAGSNAPNNAGLSPLHQRKWDPSRLPKLNVGGGTGGQEHK